MIIKNKIQVLTTTSKDFGYVVLHKSIVFTNHDIPYVLHFTFSGLEIIPLDTLLKSRHELYRRNYTLKHDVNTEDIFKDNRFKEFKLFTCNCENFANTFIDEHTTTKHLHTSQQILFWALLLIILFIRNRTK